ncbi:MAG: response regulator [Desulfobacterales bacterium]|nr:response regulator [Desulfobacterales bacterium]
MDARGNLLIVDDEADFLELAKWRLELVGFVVNVALSGDKAMEILKKEEIHVLITDIRMPGMDGIELIRKALFLRPDLQCIVITGHGGIDTAVEAMRLGAINYLRKPVGADELEVAISKGVEKRALILANRDKQERLEKANAELIKLRGQLEEALKREKTEHGKTGEALKKARLRETLVTVMTVSLRYWKETTRKSKIELAEESRLWTATLDSAGTYRTRTLDRYLRIHTLPSNPRVNDVLDTGYFILSNCPPHPDMKAKLEEKIQQLEKLLTQSP